ncbi:hypothetical protein ESOMN_v1c03940 [Williamsoniiplasma somnilux]|uniref:Uncharacterized protein n=1 Tax=Williamsoniiplasma somnilux TaxID=215578 RepID=A0A2K8NYZ5_9MOLU|nr:hypothetical protein [Williamsoniiplasma somnilux]ATZ18776.1 hypothetical protein ESOMN_v1c03940 [Williamsoniiplasma somnilux]
MLEIYKLPKLSDNELSQLNYINPWWEKTLKKLVQKNLNWIKRFNKDSNIFISLKPKEKIEDYKKLFQAVNNMQTFFEPKIKQIKNELKMIKKFQKMISDYSLLLGTCWSIVIMIYYYRDFNSLEINNKRGHSIKVFNNKNLEFYDRFKKNIINTLGNNEVLDVIFKNENFNDGKLNDSSLIVNSIVKYASKLFKNKQLSKEKYADTLLHAIIYNSLNLNFVSNYNVFVLNLLKIN